MLNRVKSLYRYWPVSGILAPVIYILADSYIVTRYPGYVYLDQAISELSAIGAPTAHLWFVLTLPFSPLLILFGLNILITAYYSVPLKVTGLLILIWGLSGYLWLLFPMNMRGNIGSSSDTGHLVMAAFTVLLIIIFITVGSGSFGRRFRIYSYLTIITMLVSGFMVGRQAPDVAAHLPTPYMGLLERISVFSPMIWVLVLAAGLLSGRDRSAS